MLLEHQAGPSPWGTEGLCSTDPRPPWATHWHLHRHPLSPTLSHAPLCPSKVPGSRTQTQEELVEIPTPSLPGKSTALI